MHRGEQSEECTALDVPQGGIVMGIAARAMATAHDAPELRLRSITQMMIFTFPDGPPPPELRVRRDLR